MAKLIDSLLGRVVFSGEVVCYYEEISAYDIADDIEVRPGEKETMLVGAVFVSGGSSRDISLQVIGPGGDDLLLKRAKGEDSFQLPIVEVRFAGVEVAAHMTNLLDLSRVVLVVTLSSLELMRCALEIRCPPSRPRYMGLTDENNFKVFVFKPQHMCRW